jgi:hypothetical protein
MSRRKSTVYFVDRDRLGAYRVYGDRVFVNIAMEMRDRQPPVVGYQRERYSDALAESVLRNAADRIAKRSAKLTERRRVMIAASGYCSHFDAIEIMAKSVHGLCRSVEKRIRPEEICSRCILYSERKSG